MFTVPRVFSFFATWLLHFMKVKNEAPWTSLAWAPDFFHGQLSNVRRSFLSVVHFFLGAFLLDDSPQVGGMSRRGWQKQSCLRDAHMRDPFCWSLVVLEVDDGNEVPHVVGWGIVRNSSRHELVERDRRRLHSEASDVFNMICQSVRISAESCIGVWCHLSTQKDSTRHSNGRAVRIGIASVKLQDA